MSDDPRLPEMPLTEAAPPAPPAAPDSGAPSRPAPPTLKPLYHWICLALVEAEIVVGGLLLYLADYALVHNLLAYEYNPGANHHLPVHAQIIFTLAQFAVTPMGRVVFSIVLVGLGLAAWLVSRAGLRRSVERAIKVDIAIGIAWPIALLLLLWWKIAALGAIGVTVSLWGP